MKQLGVFLLFVWQLPQHLLAIVLAFVYQMIYDTEIYQNATKPYKLLISRGAGLCLGYFIFLDANKPEIFGNQHSVSVLFLHELGHQKQSYILGPLYLFIVGLPSLVLYIWSKFKTFPTFKDKCIWYYSKFPENWADSLVDIDRSQANDVLN